MALAKIYDKGLKDVTSIRLPYRKAGYRHVYHLYEIETVDTSDRDRLLKHLNDNGIEVKTHYSIAIHQQEGFPWGKAARVCGPLLNAEKNAAPCISLPMFPELTDEEAQYVIQVIKGFQK